MAFTDRLHNRGSIGGYDIDNSLKLEADNTEYLEKTFSSDGNRKTYTTSMWIKRTEIGQASTLFGCQPTSGANNETTAQFGITVDDKFQCGFQTFYVVQTNRVLRDTSAWYHIVVRTDTTQSLVGDRFKVWINGEEETSFSTDNRTSIAQNQNTGINSTGPHRVGALIGNGWYFSGYMAEVHHVDGQALSPSDFAETDEDTGIWKPKAYTGSYGTNGFYLDFEDSASLGADDSGNGNNFTLNNITSADQATDTPTNNFATWNVIADTRLPSDTDRIYFNEGGTQPIKSTGTGWTTVISTQAFSSGKWYWEGEVERQDGTTMWGCFPTKTREANVYLNSYIGGAEPSGFDSGCAFYDNDDAYYHDNTSTSCTISGGTVQTIAGDIIMIAVDMDNNKFYAGRNGQWFNSTDNTHANATGITLSDEEHFFAFAAYHPSRTYKTNLGGYTTISISSAASDANGYGNFEYAPPSGYYALCTKNLAEYG